MKNLYILLLVLPVLVFAQSQNQNYIKNTTYKVATTSSISNPEPEQAAVTVQYFDGLGRPIQQVAHKQSNTGKDIIVHTGYDEFGRQTKEYLPYVRSSASLDFDSSGEANTMSFYATNNTSLTGNPYFETTGNPYSEKELEASPLSRVFKQAAPGDPWVMGDGKEIKFDYQTNTSNEVVYFKANTEWSATFGLYTIALVKDGHYVANQLYKTITKDENWTSGVNNTTEEFKNKQGQVILKRTYSNAIKHDTYYVYDIYGNLTYVIPPKVDVSQTIIQTTLDGLCYQYKYDSRNRLVEKKLPGKQWEFILYNKLDKPVATGPAFSPYGDGNIGWLITKYDAFGRVVYTGWMQRESINEQERHNIQNELNTITQPLFENKTTANVSIDGIQVRYTNQAFPTEAFELLTVNYYDNYDYPDAPTPPTGIYGDDVLTNVKTLPTGTWTRFLTTETETIGELSTTFYDKKGRSIGSATVNHMGGSAYTQSKLDFEGKVLYTDTEHKRSSSNDVVKVREDFSYTPQSKLSKHTHQINSFPAELLVKNQYDELGQLIVKKVGGTDLTGESSHQKVDYQYNIRGWLKSINNINDLSESNGHFQDLFSFKINYNTVTKKNIDTNVIEEVNDSYGQSVKKLYNGNIAETYWRSSSDNTLRKYSYAYDDLNRLNDAYYQRPEGTIEPTNAYNESLDYDKNGNISRLSRTGNYDGNDYTFVIDELEYFYHDKSNLLKKVTDSTNESLGFKDDSDGTNDTNDDYEYDNNGNMVRDYNKGILKIFYNHLNLPISIHFANEGKTISYFYNANGVKLKKAVNQGTPLYEETTTDYLGGFQYENTVLQFFQHAEGYVKHTPDKYGNPTFDYVYNYTDHLGNIRLSYTLDPLTQVLKILEENHYYPFGLKHTNYSSDRKSILKETEEDPKRVGPEEEDSFYKYKFQGQERQDELGLNWDSFKWRNYDYAIGRFMNIDPLTEEYHTWSPYVFSGNRVIDARELEGLEPLTVHKTADAAADNWGRFYNDNSIRDNQEYGSTIYPVTDKTGSIVGYSYSIAAIGTTGSTVTPSPAPSGVTGDSDIHSHAASTSSAPVVYDDNIFSGSTTSPAGNLASTTGDIGDNNRTGMNGYLTSPNGSLQKYDTKTGVITTLSTTLPSDSGTGTGAPGAGVSAPSTWSYTLQKGDTLSNVAKIYSTTVSAIQTENKIADPNKVKAGTTINITN